MKSLILLIGLLAGCGQQSSAVANRSANAAAPSEIRSEPADPPAKAFSVSDENDLYIFEYSWPAEASAVPQLAARFRTDMEKAKSELVANAREDRDARATEGFDFHPHPTQRAYVSAGQTDRLLSLQSTIYAFTGGAHGSTGSAALLWDPAIAREIAIPQLLAAGASWTGAIRQPFCLLLDRERETRRGEPVRKGDLFGECPRYDELTVFLPDSDANRRIDHVVVIADQYVAGPYAEGPYEIALPITATMIERLKPEYRSSFEPRPPVR